MKRFFCLVCCSLIFFTGCGRTSYLQTIEDRETDVTTDNNYDASVDDSATIFVQVAGAVNEPGVFELDSDARVFQAIEAAGGLSAEADDSDINQAKPLEDGEKVYVYTRFERQQLLRQAEDSAQADDGLININTATAEELKSLPGIGESKANLIISYRESNGAFATIEDIKNVSGIGEGIFNQIASYIKA